MTQRIYLTECPRDAMQGITEAIPTAQKVQYLNDLLKVGFSVLDFGSFVSPKAIPQMADTAEVLQGLERNSNTRLLAIIANARGAEQAAAFDDIDILGYPFSISETFQQRNTNADMDESVERLKQIIAIADDCGKDVRVYISMAFGNPYRDAWSPELAVHWLSELYQFGVSQFALADTVGVAAADDIRLVVGKCLRRLQDVELGVHLHARPDQWYDKVYAAWHAGCRHFDSAFNGFGGCPMAGDELVGNLATENLIGFAKEADARLGIDEQAYQHALHQARAFFAPYGIKA